MLSRRHGEWQSDVCDLLPVSIAEAAEMAIRDELSRTDRPLHLLDVVSRQLSDVIGAAALRRHAPCRSTFEDVAAAFSVAVERIWLERCGDPARIPMVEISED
ncbi:hypothetical protein [Roseomonas rosulenta]|uniref:hypothetical protein n=1 Tax=Roseomonas rosulenta TaxID=2748667 RepID=UPI0018DFDF31|nr:hypothetical protein [Roseomonas rosulenta]